MYLLEELTNNTDCEDTHTNKSQVVTNSNAF